MLPRCLAAALPLCLLMEAALAQTAPSPGAGPTRIPAPGGEVILADALDQRLYDRLKFAAARRVGNTLYISGTIADLRDGEGNDIEAAKTAFRRAFQRIQGSLKAAGLDFEDVVMINSYHVWQSPHLNASREAHFGAFAAVKDEFMRPPHAAWTAVGTTGLLLERGLAEVQMIAHIPDAKLPR